MVLVENRRAGLALGEDPEDCRTTGKDERFPRVTEGFCHHRHGVTVIRQVTRISQTTPLSSAAMFRFPHLGTPQSKIRVPHNESQMIHPTQQLSGSALRGGG